MKKRAIKSLAIMALLTMGTVNAEGQGFLKKLTKGVDNATKTLDKVTSTKTEATSSENKKTIDWSKIPTYTTQVVILTDDNGNQILNEDGSVQRRVFLIDQNGVRRSKEAVSAQIKAKNKAFGTAAAKIGGGAVLAGGLSLLKNKGKVNTETLVSAAAGAFAGFAMSQDDIATYNAHKASLKEQEALLETYAKTFTDEGVPVNAQADLSNVDGIDFTKGDPVSQTASEVQKELESEGFNSTDTSYLDELLNS